MKSFAFLSIVFASIYFYVSASTHANLEINSYHDLLNKVEETSVTFEEIKFGANILALTLCNDESFQTSSDSTVKQCFITYQNMKKMCEDRIFEPLSQMTESKDHVIQTTKRYIKCVGIK